MDGENTTTLAPKFGDAGMGGGGGGGGAADATPTDKSATKTAAQTILFMAFPP
jgi:hypothetical protein